jgi:hypothetical protein
MTIYVRFCARKLLDGESPSQNFRMWNSQQATQPHPGILHDDSHPPGQAADTRTTLRSFVPRNSDVTDIITDWVKLKQALQNYFSIRTVHNFVISLIIKTVNYRNVGKYQTTWWYIPEDSHVHVNYEVFEKLCFNL